MHLFILINPIVSSFCFRLLVNISALKKQQTNLNQKAKTKHNTKKNHTTWTSKNPNTANLALLLKSESEEVSFKPVVRRASGGVTQSARESTPWVWQNFAKCPARHRYDCVTKELMSDFYI